MAFIQNCAASDVATGFHHAPGDNAILIQITDPASWRATPKHTFKEVYHFEFLDVEKDTLVDDEEMRISDGQAAELVRILQHAKDNDMNVIVHCFAGVCRSGAVCEVGVMMGFDDTRRYRQPNLLVKHKMMQALGWNYNENEVEDPEAWRSYRLDGDI